MRKSFLIIPAVTVSLLLTACLGNQDNKQGGQNATREQKAVGTSFNRVADSQPVPTFDWSQERQTVIDIENIQATGTATTSAGYLEGIGLVWWCPSIGAPVPSTYQLSATKQWVDLPGDNSRTLYDVDQGEPTGVYVGQSTGTWTICLDNNGKKFGVLWEGYVASTVGVDSSYPPEKRKQITSSTYDFKEAPKK